MPKNTQKTSGINRKAAVSIVIALFLGLPIVILATQQRTNTQEHASQFNDLNTSYAITQTNNTDGTMGPATAAGDYSTTFPDIYLGNLNFKVTDPPQSRENAVRSGNPFFQSTPLPTHNFPTQAQNNDNQGQNNAHPTITPPNVRYNISTPGSSQSGPQSVTSLTVTITKVEVHLAQVGLPGSENEKITPHPTPVKGNRSESNTRNSNQSVNKWETLSLTSPIDLDLVQLAKTHNFSSLGITKLVNGRYTEIRLYISKAHATLANGSKITLTIPGKENIVRVVQSFIIDSGRTTTLTMYFDAQNSVINVGDQYILKPVVANFRETIGN